MNSNHQDKIDYWIGNLSEDHANLVSYCRDLIHNMVPQVEERFSFGIPFYHYFGMFCYINKVQQGIMLGFCRGKDLVLTYPQLKMQGRKMVAGLIITEPADFSRLQVRDVIAGAAIWQQEAFLLNRKFVKRKK